MIVRSIKLTDFRGVENASLELDSHLNLFIGVNGAGKSSMIDAITCLLSGFTKRMLSLTANNNPIAPKDVRNQSLNGCMVSIEVMDQEKLLNWSFYKSSKTEKNGKSDTLALQSITKEYRMQMDENPNACLPIVVQYGVRRSVTDIPLKISKKEFALQNETYIDSLDCAASFRQFFQWYRNQEDYENELKRDNAQFEDRGLSAIRKALSIALPNYTDLRVRRRPTQGLYMSKNGVEYRLEQLSDGEKCYISLVCDIVRRLTLANPIGDILKGHGVVLIDEVDLHLHPQWEKSIMECLHKAFPNVQFIVTAHSPLVASHFDGNVYAVDNGVYRQLPKIFGLDYSTILQDFMGTTPGNKQLQVLAEMYLSYKRNDMREQADEVWNKIVEIVNNTDSLYLKDLKKKAAL